LNLLEANRDPGILSIKEELKARLFAYEREWGLEGYIEGDNFVILEPFVPRPYRNRAFPLFHEKIADPAEKRGMNALFDEVLQAIEKETVVRLGDLDLATWQENGGFSDDQIRELLRLEGIMRESKAD
jgi:hypothetical protein